MKLCKINAFLLMVGVGIITDVTYGLWTLSLVDLNLWASMFWAGTIGICSCTVILQVSKTRSIWSSVGYVLGLTLGTGLVVLMKG